MLDPYIVMQSSRHAVFQNHFTASAVQGSLFPIQTGIKAAWLHENERSTLNAIIGLCWAFFQAAQSAVTPYFMTGEYSCGQ